MKYISLILAILIISILNLSFALSCSYPKIISCDTENEVNSIEQEWINDKCTEIEMMDCIRAWTNNQQISECIPNWQCSSWSPCMNNQQIRMCADGCDNQRQESRECCTPNWICGSWSNCNNGQKTRTCNDGCGNTKTEKDYCQVASQINKQIENYPIIFVHGWTSDSDAFIEMENKLGSDGYTQKYNGCRRSYNKPLTYRVDTYNYEQKEYNNMIFRFRVDTSIAKHAEKLKQEIENIKSCTGYSKVNIIAHSMGGLTARYYIKNLAGASSINKLIILGTPNHGARDYTDWFSQWYSHPEIYGSSVVEIFPSAPTNFDPSAPELKRSSSFLYNLNSEDETPGDIKYYTIYTSYDELVSQSSVYLNGAKNYQDTRCQGPIAHFSLRLPSKCHKAYEYILDALADSSSQSSYSTTNNNQNTITGNAILLTQTENKQRYCCSWFIFCFRWCYK